MKTIVVAAAAMVATPVLAADAPMYVDDGAISMATNTDSVFDGPYAGIGVSLLTSTTITENIWAIDGYLGANATFDSFLLGAEVFASFRYSDIFGGSWYGAAGVDGRAGYVIDDMAVIYGSMGLEMTSGGNAYATPGAGIEFAVSEDVSLDLQYKYYWGLNNGWRGHGVSASVLWHFD